MTCLQQTPWGTAIQFNIFSHHSHCRCDSAKHHSLLPGSYCQRGVCDASRHGASRRHTSDSEEPVRDLSQPVTGPPEARLGCTADGQQMPATRRPAATAIQGTSARAPRRPSQVRLAGEHGLRAAQAAARRAPPVCWTAAAPGRVWIARRRPWLRLAPRRR